MNTTYEKTDMAYRIEICKIAEQTINELREATGAKIKEIASITETNKACFMETMKIIRAYLDIMKSLQGDF